MIAFVMSGGGSRGALEAGALLELFEAGIQPDLLVGTSAGALNAACLAVNPTLAGARRVADLWIHARQADFFPGGRLARLWRLLRGRSLFPNEPLRRFLEREVLRDKPRFGDLEGVKLYITAANLNTGTLYLYGDQPEALIVDAVMASAAQPLAFPPVKYGDWQLVDGGVVANVPVGIAVDKGATEVYILNVGYSGQVVRDRNHVLEVLSRSFGVVMYQQFLLDLKHALERGDVTLHHIGMGEFQGTPLWNLSLGAQMVEAGRRAARDYLQNPIGLQGIALMMPEPAAEGPPPAGAETYVPSWLVPSGLLDLPALQCQIAIRLMRHGPADAATLAPALGVPRPQVEAALAALAEKGQVGLSSDGQAQIVLGRVRRRQLPAPLWLALCAEDEEADG